MGISSQLQQYPTALPILDLLAVAEYRLFANSFLSCSSNSGDIGSMCGGLPLYLIVEPGMFWFNSVVFVVAVIVIKLSS